MSDRKILKRIFAVSIVSALTLSLIGFCNANAAERVDTSKPVTITAKIDDNDQSVFASTYSGQVEINLYKLANITETGDVELLDKYSNSNIDLSVLNNNPTVEDVNTKIVEPAKRIADGTKPDETITIDKSTGAKSESITIENGAGLYLYIPKDAADGRYKYSFTRYVLMAPTSEYISTGSGSDEWNYSSSFSLKSSEEERFGSLEIVKTLDSFNSSLGTASFIYEVTAVRDNETVFNNVYSIDFTNAGNKSRVIDNIPADSDVTVKELYSGASYSVNGDASKNTKIIADKTVTTDFENDYDGRLISGGISAENHFENEDGVINWIDASGNKVEQ